jgi:hypothetical protein
MSFADRERNQAARAFIGRTATAAARRVGASLRAGRVRATNTLNAVRNRVALRRGQAGKRPRSSIGPSAGKFKKPKKAVLVKGILLKRECFGTIDTRNAAYVGFQTTSGRDNLTRSFAESLLREVLFKVGVSIESRDTAIPWGGAGDFRSYNFIRISYTNVALSGTTTFIFVDVALATGSAYKTYDAVVEAILATLKDKLFTDSPRYDLSGWRLFAGFAFDPSDSNSSAKDVPIEYNDHVGDSMYTLSVKTNMKIQNVTPADGNDQDSNSITANPLEGKIYKFSDHVPHMRQNTVRAGHDLLAFTDSSRRLGMILGPVSSDDAYESGGLLFSPFNGKVNFKNCTMQGNVKLAPGSHKSFQETFTYKGTVTKFFTGIRQGAAHRPTFGKSTIIGLEPTLRTAINESVKLAYNLDVVVNTSLFSKKKLIIPSANTHETLSN